MERVATHETKQRQPAATGRPVDGHRLHSISGTRGIEATARREYRRDRPSVDTERAEQQPTREGSQSASLSYAFHARFVSLRPDVPLHLAIFSGKGQSCPGESGAGERAPRDLRPLARSADSCWNVSPAASGRATSTQSTSGRNSVSKDRHAAFSRRRSRFRSTAFPTRRETTRPSRGPSVSARRSTWMTSSPRRQLAPSRKTRCHSRLKRRLVTPP
jgi:hypothetical protein